MSKLQSHRVTLILLQAVLEPFQHSLYGGSSVAIQWTGHNKEFVSLVPKGFWVSVWELIGKQVLDL